MGIFSPQLLFNVHTVTGTDGIPVVYFPDDGFVYLVDLHNYDNDSGPCSIAIFGVKNATQGQLDGYMQLITNVYLDTNRTVGVAGWFPVKQGWCMQGKCENSTAGDRVELRLMFIPLSDIQGL